MRISLIEYMAPYEGAKQLHSPCHFDGYVGPSVTYPNITIIGKGDGQACINVIE